MADPKNKWSQPVAPPAPMFFGEKERDLVKQVNDELAERVVGQTIAYYPISIEDSNFNDLYGEAIEKVSLPPVRVFAYVEVANEQTNEKYGYDYKSSLTVNFHRKRLVDDQNLYVRVGDFIQYGDEYYEIVRTYNDTRYYFGQVQHKFQITADCITARAGNFKVMPAVDRPVDKTSIDPADGSTRAAPRSAPYPPVDADYLTLTRQPRVTNSRYLVAGTGITFTDGGRLAGLTIDATGQNAVGMTGSIQYQTGGGTFSGSANLVYLTGSDTLSLTGDISASANVSASAFYGDGSNLSGITTGPAGADTQVQYNDEGALAGSSNLTFNGTSLTVTGDLTASVNVSASAFYGDGSNLTGITSGGGSANAQGPVGSLQFQTGSGGISGSAALSFATASSALTVGGDISVSSMTASGDVVLDQDQRIYFESDKGTWIETDSADRLRFVVGSNQMLLLDEDDDRVNIGYGNKLGVGLGNNTTPSALLHVSSSDDEDLFRVDGATAGNVLFATGSGRVGIGTTSPDYTLDVAGDIGVDQYIYHNGDANTYLNFTNDRLRFNVGGISYIDLNDAGAAPHDITFNDGGNNVDFIVKGNGSNEGNPLFKTDASTGRVGINGVGSPSWELDVDGDIGLSEYIYHREDEDTYIRFPTGDKIHLVAGGVNFLYAWQKDADVNKLIFNEDYTDTDIVFRSTDGANNKLLYLDASTHRVGVGTGFPSHLLTVAGASHLSGGLVHKRTAVTSNYTASTADYILGITSVPVSIQFDATDFAIGQVIVIKDESGAASSSDPITLTPSGSQTIDGFSSIPIESAYGALLLYSNGANWFIY